MEQNGPEFFVLHIPLTVDKPVRNSFEDHRLVREASIPTYVCPARRETPQLTANGMCSVGDYANVSRADAGGGIVAGQPRTWDGAMLVSKVFNTAAGTQVIQGISLGTGDFRAMTSFADVVDGLSYTAFIGEKAVHRDRLGGNRGNFALTTLAGEQDGTYYHGSGAHTPASLAAPGVIAYWSRRLAPSPDGWPLISPNPDRDDPANRFGSSHPSFSYFVMGDGSVRSVNHDTSSAVLQRLGSRNDRHSFELP
jgi:hypothetical protein